MERFYLITNRAKDPDLTVTDQIRQYLEERGKTCLLCDNSEKGEKYHYTDPAKVPSDIDGILVLGGDGTLLQAAGDVVDLQIPLLGINLGTLGYLAEIDRDTLYPALDHLMADEYTIEHRMMLCGSIYRDGKLIAEDTALNDITITREGNLRVVRFDNYVNGEFLNSYSADGIIIATPTGSTGYSLSAGGPIISPSASLMLMTPLAPHTLNTRSIVFPAEDVIEVELGPSRDGGIEQGMAYFDGDTRVPMKTGDRIVIKKGQTGHSDCEDQQHQFSGDIKKENGKHLRYSYWGRMLEMKIARHAQIIKLINQYDIETQEELAKKLEESGFAVTQATISRDIRQLKLTKVPKENGGSRYAVLQNAPSEVGSRYARVLKDAYISVDLAKNILVIKTVSGMAMAAAAAFDEMNWNEIVGCIGGDDTILCVARDDDAALVAAERLKKMVDGMEETGEEF